MGWEREDIIIKKLLNYYVIKLGLWRKHENIRISEIRPSYNDNEYLPEYLISLNCTNFMTMIVTAYTAFRGKIMRIQFLPNAWPPQVSRRTGHIAKASN